MKVVTENTAILQQNFESNVGNSAVAYMKNSPFAFKILSEKLYKNKVETLCREYGCNARDANVMNGLEKTPILVKLPNELDSSFFIQDNGTGLSFDQIKELIMGYFASGKTHTNQATGMFGLGAKCGFSYSDQFTVVSAHNGVETSYLVYKNKEGMPEVVQWSDSAENAQKPVSNDWPSGIRISIPVKNSDFSSFKWNAIKVFRWFDTTPVVRGADFGLKKIQFKYQAENVKFLTEVSSLCENDSYTGISLIMGDVAYPIELESIKAKLEGKVAGATRFYEILSTKGVALYVPIGAVQVAVSRESLEYTEETIETVSEELGKAIKLIAKSISDKLLESNPSWADLLARALNTNNQSVSKMTSELGWIMDSFSEGFMNTLVNILKLDAEKANKLKDVAIWLKSSHVAIPDGTGNSYEVLTDIKSRASVNMSLGLLPQNLGNVNEESFSDKAIKLFEQHRKTGVVVYSGVLTEKSTKKRYITKPDIAEVYNGKSKGGKNYFAINPNTAIYFADCKDAKARFKEYFKLMYENGATYLLVDSRNQELAKKYAELVSEASLGVPVRKASELPELPKVARSKRVSTKQLGEAARAQVTVLKITPVSQSSSAKIEELKKEVLMGDIFEELQITEDNTLYLEINRDKVWLNGKEVYETISQGSYMRMIKEYLAYSDVLKDYSYLLVSTCGNIKKITDKMKIKSLVSTVRGEVSDEKFVSKYLGTKSFKETQKICARNDGWDLGDWKSVGLTMALFNKAEFLNIPAQQVIEGMGSFPQKETVLEIAAEIMENDHNQQKIDESLISLHALFSRLTLGSGSVCLGKYLENGDHRQKVAALREKMPASAYEKVVSYREVIVQVMNGKNFHESLKDVNRLMRYVFE